jgi:hypothetical protein
MNSILRTLALAAVAATSLASAPASAIEFDSSPSTPSRAVINAVFRDYIGNLVGARIETAVVDINADGVGEIVARFVHSSACRNASSKCRTVMIRHTANKWGIVLDTYSEKVDVPKTEKFVFTNVDVDGTKWKWNGAAYGPLMDGLGDKLAFTPVPKEMVQPLSTAFGEGAVKAIAAGNLGINLEFSKPGLDAGGEYLLVRMKGQIACGDAAGCPVRLLQKSNGTWQTILEAGSAGDVAVSKIVRDGHKDIMFGTPKGFVTMGWSGKYYAVAEAVEAVAAPK